MINNIDISFTSTTPKGKADVLVIPVFEGGKLTEQAESYVNGNKGYIKNHIEDQSKFKGKLGQVFHSCDASRYLA